MQRSTDRILTTHAGRLQGPVELSQLANRARTAEVNWTEYHDAVRGSMTDLIKRQAEAGIDIVSDGELGKLSGYAYYSQRMTGLATRPLREGEPALLTFRTNERLEFAEFYAQLNQGGGGVTGGRAQERTICSGPISYTGQEYVQRDIETFKSALSEANLPVQEAFMPVLAPGWLEHFIFNEYYASDEEYLFALAEAMSHEYRAIVDAGFILQVDDPALATKYDMFVPALGVEDYRKIAALRVEALNHALRGIPEDRIRYHLCWGSWHGPHSHDLPLVHIVDLMLRVRAGAYSVEAGNGQHEHEWKVWQDTKLPEGKVLIPGIVSHVSNTIEHPDLISDRIERFAAVVGRENVIAGTDCGMGGRVHMQIGWAKLKALSQGADRASKKLWG